MEPASTAIPARPTPARKSAARVLRTRRTAAPELTGTGYLSVVAVMIVDMTQRTAIAITGPYDLREVALMGFGHRDETSFDGTMRMAFCLDGGYERSVGVAARQERDRLALEVVTADGPLTADELDALARQVARVVSLDHDGEAFDRMCRADPALAAVHAAAPGFRPALFYSPYEAAVWSIVSARRPRSQGIALRSRLAEQAGATFSVAGADTLAVPSPSRLLQVESIPGLPADRISRLHAVAEAARAGKLEADRLRALPPEAAQAELQELPGIGPFYSSLVLIRACGHADLPAPDEPHSRAAIQAAYGLDHEPSAEEVLRIAEGWRPFRTWVTVMLRALSGRAPAL
jgi:DNA-3-methyladenine glycosylase II